MSSPRSTSTIRWAEPCPSVTAPPSQVAGQPAADVRQRPRGVAAIGVDRLRRTHDRLVIELVVRDEGCHRPPRHAELEGVTADLADRPVRRGTEIDRGLAAAGRGRPRGFQELLAGPDQVARPGADPFRIAQHDVRAGGELVDQQHQSVDEDRRQRLHPLDRDAVGDLVEHLGQLRVLGRQVAGPLPHLSRSTAAPGRAAPTVRAAPPRASAGRRSRTSGPPRHCRPRTRCAADVPRSAGRRR